MSRKRIIRKADEPKPVVVNQIIVKQPYRKVYDVGDWRNALRAADIGRTKQLYDLFDDILVDGLLADAIEKRIDAILNAELTFQDAKGKEVDMIADIMDTADWEELLRQIMNERMYGRSAVEILCSQSDFHVEQIPAKHIDIDHKFILINPGDDHGISYEKDNSLLVLGRPRNFGLLLKATPYAIYKRGGFGDWSQWIELFGMPQRVGKYNSYDPESRKLLEKAMEEAGSAPYIVIPKEAEVETITTTYSGSKSSYNEFRQACNEEMLITILGQTLTTVQGENGARSLGEVHKEVEEGKNKSDMRFVQRVLNQRVLPMLEARGYPVAGGSFIFPKSAEALSVSEIVELSNIMPIPQSYLHDKYSIPVPDANEPIAGQQIAASSSNLAAQNPSGANNQSLTDSISEEASRSFFRRLMDFFVQAPTTGATSISTSQTTLKDESFDEALIRRVAAGDSPYFDAGLYRHVANEFLNAIHTAFKQGIKHVDGVAYDDLDDAFVTAMEQNLFHFSAAKTLAEIQQLNQEFRKSKSFEEFYRNALLLCSKYNKTWARAERNTAILTAESAANYQRLIKKINLFPFWQYLSAGDEKVRLEHRKLHQVILWAKDPRWDKIWPPNGWNCRCRVKPLLRNEVTLQQVKESQERVDAYFESVGWKKIEATHFGTNLGKRAEVFNKDMMYIRKFPNQAAKYMEKVKPVDWGLKHSYKQLIHDSTQKVTEYQGDAEQWWETHNIDNMLPVTDYNQRTWSMDKEKFDSHTTDKKKKRAFRSKYLNCLDEIMQEPDEVWLGADEEKRQQKDNFLNQWYYIKYYEGVALVCVCNIQNKKLNLKSWYELHDDRIRKGLLIYHR